MFGFQLSISCTYHVFSSLGFYISLYAIRFYTVLTFILFTHTYIVKTSTRTRNITITAELVLLYFERISAWLKTSRRTVLIHFEYIKKPVYFYVLFIANYFLFAPMRHSSDLNTNIIVSQNFQRVIFYFFFFLKREREVKDIIQTLYQTCSLCFSHLHIYFHPIGWI